MPTGYDLIYAAAVTAAAPAWGLRTQSRRKVLAAFRHRFGRGVPGRVGDGPAVLVHAVSVGEVNATAALVDRLLAARPGVDVTVSVTTDTGFERATALYAGRAGTTVIRYPLDFSAAVGRVLDARRPAVAVLMELEVWPNFLRECRRRGIAVVLANGRLTRKSHRRYRLAGPVASAMFRRLARVLAQDRTYADRFVALGADPAAVEVVGTMKFDTAADLLGDAPPPGTDALAASVGLRPGGGPVWVCGSTGPGEEALILGAYRRLLGAFPALRLAIVPRHPPRFDEVAALIESAGFGLVRRSWEGPARAGLPGHGPPPGVAEGPAGAGPSQPPVVLGDTMGELRAFYALADVVFVGRSLMDLGASQHGSDMIEPAALGRPTIVGPFTGNFDGPMAAFRAAGAVVEVADAAGLEAAIGAALADPSAAADRGRRGREVVRREQGATDRHLRVIVDLLDAAGGTGRPSSTGAIAGG